jgi:chromosome segregation ATPase
MNSIQNDEINNSNSSIEPEEIQNKEETPTEEASINNIDKDIVEQYHLKSELDRINEDIKVCELYKKNLEKEIKDFKKSVSEKKYLEDQISFLRLELVTLQKEQDLLKIENKALSLENERLQKYQDKIKSDIDSILQKFQEAKHLQDFTISSKEILKNELTIIEKSKDSLLEEISVLKEEKIKINSDIEKLNLESNSLQEKFDSELEKIKSNLGLNNNYNNSSNPDPPEPGN